MDEELKQAIEQAKEQQPVEISLEWYVNLQLKDVKTFIRANINSASRSFVAIGYYLKYIRDHKLFTEDGYQNIWEFAQDEFGISKSSASRFMAINDRFSKDGNSPILLDQYKDFSSSKLSEMLTMTDEQLEQVTLATTVAEIRGIKNPEKVVATSQQTEPEPEKSVSAQFEEYSDELNGIIYDYTNAVAKQIIKSYHNEMRENYMERVLDVLTSQPWLKAVFQRDGVDGFESDDDSYICEFRNAGLLFLDPRSRELIGKQSWFRLAAAIQSMWNEVTIENAEKQLEVEINPYDEKKPEPDTMIYVVGGNGDIKKHEVISKYSDFSPKYFNTKDKSGAINNISCESEHWHYSREDAKKDPWYREKKSNKPRLVNDIPEIVDELPCDTCGLDKEGCCYYEDTPDDYCVQGDKWSPREDEPDPVETVEADIIQPDKEYDFDKIAAYDLLDVKAAINGHADNLVQYKDVELDAPVVKREKMEYDALKLLEEDMCIPELKELPKPVQPEMPILKNNDQRKAFIDAYASWPIWIDMDQTGERYYRYDLSDKVAMVVKVSLRHVYQGYKETEETDYISPQYYLLGIKTSYSTKVTYHEDPSRTFAECSSNMTDMVNYLKEFQKK